MARTGRLFKPVQRFREDKLQKFFLPLRPLNSQARDEASGSRSFCDMPGYGHGILPKVL